MTMKPKPKKFRVRRAATGQTEGQLTSATSGDKVFETTDDGFGDADFRAAPPRDGASPKQAAIDRELAAIRAEGLTGRQLRMARRVAQMRGVTPSSDFDAVRQLRAMGVDPFAKANMLELVAGANVPAVTPAPQTPQTPPPAPAGVDAAPVRRT